MAFADSLTSGGNGNLTTTAGLINSLHDETTSGWAALSETFTYASSSTITIATGGASRFQVGDKLKFTNSTTKYVYVITVADTLLTVTGGSDYSVANAAITSIYLSRADRPFGFPSFFNWSPTLVGFSANPTNTLYAFRVIDGWCHVSVRQATNGTSNATSLTISAPINPKTVSNGHWSAPFGSAVDNGSALTTAGRISISSGDTVITLNSNMASGAWTNANGKSVNFTNFAYPIV